MPEKFAFVLTDDRGKIGSQARQVVRHHCMRQKNKQPGSRRSKREAAQKELRLLANHSSWNGSDLLSGAPGASSLPRAPPSDWALFPFADTMDTSSQRAMHQYFVRNPIRDPLCPFKYYGVIIDFDQDHLSCFRMLISDNMCFYAMLLLASASEDLISHRPLSTGTRRHLHRTLPLLNDRLSELDAHKNDKLLYVVGILASMAVLFREFDAAKMHCRGISKIMSLRGGPSTSDASSGVRLSIDRLNFSSMLVTDLWEPFVFSDETALAYPVFPAEVIHLYHTQSMICLEEVVNEDLATVFKALQHTAILFNLHHNSATPINGSFLQHCVGFIQSSLIQLRRRFQEGISQCLHLAMMAFLATTFRLPDVYNHPCSTILATELEESYAAVTEMGILVPERLKEWILFVYLLSTEKVPELGKTPAFEATFRGLGSWNQVRRQLKQVMWMDPFHDHFGKTRFDTVVTLSC